MDILLASVILVIIIKTVVVTIVVKGFGYSHKTSLLVGLISSDIFSVKLFIHVINFDSRVSFVGWYVTGPDRGICICVTKSCFKPSSRGGIFISIILLQQLTQLAKVA